MMYFIILVKKLLVNLLYLPVTLFLIIKDNIKYYRSGQHKVYDGFGLHLYIARFGQGKTCSMIHDVYNIAKRYKELTIITNIHLTNFPEYTKILPLRSVDDIINAPDQSIIVVDEIGTIFNSRDFAKGLSVPKVLFQVLCQVRHRHISLYGTSQRYHFVDKQIRDILTDVRVVSSYFGNFKRACNILYYDADEYERAYNNSMLPLSPVHHSFYIMSDKVRALYDTYEMVATDLTTPIYSDSDDMRTFSSSSLDKKGRRAARRSVGLI